MPSCAFRVVVGFEAERIRLVVAVQEAHHLLDALRNAQDAVGDVGFARPADLQMPPLAFDDCGAGELHAAHPRLRRIEHRIEKFQRDLVGVRRHQLIELVRLPHHRIVEERDCTGLSSRLSICRVASTARNARSSSCRRGGEPDRQVRERDQNSDHAQCVEHDLAAPLSHHRPELGAQRETPHPTVRRPRDRARWPGHRASVPIARIEPPVASSPTPASRIRMERTSDPSQRRHSR